MAGRAITVSSAAPGCWGPFNRHRPACSIVLSFMRRIDKAFCNWWLVVGGAHFRNASKAETGLSTQQQKQKSEKAAKDRSNGQKKKRTQDNVMDGASKFAYPVHESESESFEPSNSPRSASPDDKQLEREME